HDDRRVRKIEQSSEQYTGLAKAMIVALQSGENEMEFFFLDGCGKVRRRAKRIELRKIIVGDVNAAIRAFRQRFLDRLLHTLWSHRERDNFTTVLFFQPQRLFERVTVGLVHLKADV